MWQYIAYTILLTCENVYDIDIAYPILHSGDNIAILPNLNTVSYIMYIVLIHDSYK